VALVLYLEVVSLSESVTFGEYAERWITQVAPLRLKPTAVAEYSSLLRLHLLPTFAGHPLASISPDEIQEYMAHQVESGVSPRSVRNHLAVLRAVLKTAVAFDLVDTNAAMKVTAPRYYRKEQRFLTPSEMKAVLDACPRAWALLLALPMYAAGRKSECLGLRWSSVSITRRQIAFVRSMRGGIEDTVKSAASHASVSMAEELVPLFLERREKAPDPVNGLVFCRSDGVRALDDGTPNRVLRRACVKAGIEPCSFHALRHSSIAALIATNAHPLVVSRFARHATIETTLGVYGHLLAPLAGGDAIDELSRTISGS
jgi:integrase